MVESCQEALQEAGHGREVLSKGQKLSEGPPGGPGKARRPSQKAGRRWEALPVGRGWGKAFLGLCELSGGPPRWLGVVGSHSRWDSSGQEALPEHREWFKRSSRNAMSGWVAIQECQEWSGGPPGGTGVIGWPSL